MGVDGDTEREFNEVEKVGRGLRACGGQRA